MTTMWQDMRYGVRMLGRSPGLTVAAVLCLGLGIGATTTIFSVVNGALLRSFPYERPDELALLWEENSQDPLYAEAKMVSYANLQDCKQSSQAFRDMTVIGGTSYPMRYGDLFESIRALKVTSSFFDLLGVRPALGRCFTPEEEKEGRQQVAILTDACWRNWFQADPNVVGKSVLLRLPRYVELSFTIVGVMPPRFVQPVIPWFPADLLIPFDYGETQVDRGSRRCQAVGRLREGATLRQAQAELAVISRRLAQDHPKENAGYQLTAGPLRSQYCGAASRVLVLLIGASALLLVVACGNVADLLLIRGLQRQREVAVRATLGAGRWRVLRQLAVEGLLLATLGLLAGVVISVVGLGLLRPLILSHVPVVGGLRVDLKALAVAAGVAWVTGMVFGLIPARQAWKTDLVTAFRGDVTHATTGRQTRRVHSLLAASQMALAFLLIAGAGLAVRTFSNLLRIDPGFDPRPVLAMHLDFQRGGYEYRRQAALQEELLNRIRRLPGVVAAATSNGLPLFGQGDGFLFDIKGDLTPSPDGYQAYSSWVSAEYFRTVGVRLLQGRYFSEADRLRRDRRALIINHALAERFWPSGHPIGQLLNERRRGACEIIGVVENECYRDGQLTGKLEVSPRVYLNQYYSGSANLTVRAQGDPLALAPAVKAIIHELDDQILVSHARRMEDDLHEAFRLQQLTMLLVGVFALFAFTLSVVGLYGVMAHSARSRFQEIAVRIAIGARPADVVGIILKQGALVVVVGLGAGLAGLVALARVAASYIYGVAPLDPLTLAGAGLLLGAASAVACGLPARRAARIDPMAALRYE
jgi:putative ABC transport system permease protein